MFKLSVRKPSVLAAALILSAVGTAQGGIYTIFDGNSEVRFDINSTAPNSRVGMDRWFVDGVNHMYSQWFWYRDSSMTQEERINSLPLLGAATSNASVIDPRDDTFNAVFGAQGGWEFDVRFTLTGGTAGSNTSDVAESIRIINRSSVTRTISFFQYADFDLNDDILDDLVEVVNPNLVRQVDFLSGTTVAETVAIPTPLLSEVGVYAATLIRLDDGNLDNLDGSVGPLVGRRDYTWAFQWEFTIEPGGSRLISKDKLLTPAPGAAVLLGLAGLVAGRRRR